MLVDSDSPEKGFKPGWQEAIVIDPQLVAERGRVWADQLSLTLSERLRYFEKNQMPQAYPRGYDPLRSAHACPYYARIGTSFGAYGDGFGLDSSIPDRRKKR